MLPRSTVWPDRRSVTSCDIPPVLCWAVCSRTARAREYRRQRVDRMSAGAVSVLGTSIRDAVGRCPVLSSALQTTSIGHTPDLTPSINPRC